MNIAQLKPAVSTIFGLVCIVAATVAAAKVFGFGVPIRGGVMELAAVAIAASFARNAL